MQSDHLGVGMGICPALAIPEMPYRRNNTAIEAVSMDRAAVARATTQCTEARLREFPCDQQPAHKWCGERSHDISPAMAEATNPRPKPSSCATGLRKTPRVNVYRPCPTIKPNTDARTTHHRFRKICLMLSPAGHNSEVICAAIYWGPDSYSALYNCQRVPLS